MHEVAPAVGPVLERDLDAGPLGVGGDGAEAEPEELDLVGTGAALHLAMAATQRFDAEARSEVDLALGCLDRGLALGVVCGHELHAAQVG